MGEEKKTRKTIIWRGEKQIRITLQRSEKKYVEGEEHLQRILEKKNKQDKDISHKNYTIIPFPPRQSALSLYLNLQAFLSLKSVWLCFLSPPVMVG